MELDTIIGNFDYKRQQKNRRNRRSSDKLWIHVYVF